MTFRPVVETGADVLFRTTTAGVTGCGEDNISRSISSSVFAFSFGGTTGDDGPASISCSISSKVFAAAGLKGVEGFQTEESRASELLISMLLFMTDKFES